MKKICLLVLISLTLILSSCGLTGKTINDYKIDFSNSMSIVVKRQDTPTQIFKAYDENGNALLLEIGQSGDITAESKIWNIIELPEIITDFKIIGYSGNNEHKCNLLLDTNDGLYIISPIINRQFDYKYDIYKIEDESSINKEIKNILYKSQSINKLQTFRNAVLKNTSIINENNYISYVNDEREIVLLENVKLLNAFFAVEYDTVYQDLGVFRQFVILDTDNNAYYYLLSEDYEIDIQKKMEYEKKVIDYGYIGSIGSNVSKYFYILTEDSLFIYDEIGVLFYSMKIEETVYGINFVNDLVTFEIQLAYRTEDDLFIWKKQTIEKTIEGNIINEK